MVETLISPRARALIGHQNYILTGALTASDEVPGLGVGNLRDEQASPSVAWQTPSGVLAASLLIDAGEAKEWRLFGLHNTNLSPSARVRWRVGSVANMVGGVVFNSGFIPADVRPGYRQTVFSKPAPTSAEAEGPFYIVTEEGHRLITSEGRSLISALGPSRGILTEVASQILTESGRPLITEGTGRGRIATEGTIGRYCLCEIEDYGNTQGFLNIPLAYAGGAWEPGRQISSDSAWGVDVSVDEVVTRGGAEYPVTRFNRRRWDFTIQALPDAEVWPWLAEVMRVARTNTNILFVPFPAGNDTNYEAVFGRMTWQDVTFPHPTKTYRGVRARVTERL